MNKYKFILSLIFIIALGTIKVNGQTDFKSIDSKSLNCYMNSQWDSVLYYNKIAKKENIDYYYLTYRVAVAHFYLGEYITATHYFDKAIKQNESAESDLFLIDLYYRALLYSKQYALAENIFTKTDSLDEQIGVKHKGDFYVGFINGNTLGTFNQKKLRMNPENIYSQYTYQQSLYNIGVGGTFVATGKLEIDFRYAYTYLGMVTAAENMLYFNIRNYDVNQHVFNVKPKIHLNKRANLDLAFGYHSVSGKPYGAQDSTLEMDFYDYETSSVMAGIGYNYRIKNTQFGLNAVFSNFLDLKNYQFGASFQWYPKGNFDVYSNTEITAFKPENGDFRPLVYQKIGGKINNEFWLEVSGIYGDVQNITMLNANYSFETSYKTNWLAGAKLIYIYSPSLTFYAGPQYVSSYNNKVQDVDNKTVVSKKINYSQLNIMGGLQWKY